VHKRGQGLVGTFATYGAALVFLERYDAFDGEHVNAWCVEETMQ
jgi:hypothetical protein